jgi:hypothetical protein
MEGESATGESATGESGWTWNYRRNCAAPGECHGVNRFFDPVAELRNYGIRAFTTVASGRTGSVWTMLMCW